VQIERHQMAAMAVAQQRDFAGELVAHLGALAPARARVAGEAPLRALAALGLERAAAHGLDRRGAVRLHVECMAMFGSGFDTDPLCPLGAALRAESAVPDALLRADRLHALASAWSREIAGEDGLAEARAWGRLAQAASAPAPALAPPPDEIAAGLLRLWPEKAAAAGPQAVAALVREACAVAGRQGRAWRAAAPADYAALMMVLGHECFSDPQYPWLAEAFAPGLPALVLAELRERFAAWAERMRRAAREFEASLASPKLGAAPPSGTPNAAQALGGLVQGPPGGLPDALPRDRASAPPSIRLPRLVLGAMRKAWAASFPDERACMHGGTLVKDALGDIQARGLGAGSAAIFRPERGVAAEGEKLVGTFHTRPFDAAEGELAGLGLSGADIDYACRHREPLYVEAGDRQFAIVPTLAMPAHADGAPAQDWLRQFGARLAAGASPPQAGTQACEAVARAYGLVYYEGRDGVLARTGD